MLATFGLERLESGLAENTLTASDVAEFLEQAEPIDVHTLAREGMPEALDCLHRRIERAADESARHASYAEPTTDPLLTAAVISGGPPPRLPRQRHDHSWANRQFDLPEHANRV